MGGKKTKKKPAKAPAEVAQEAKSIVERNSKMDEILQKRLAEIDKKVAQEAAEEAPEEVSGDELELDDGDDEERDVVYLMVRMIQTVGGTVSWPIMIFDTREECEGHCGRADRELQRLLPAMLVVRGQRNKVINTGKRVTEMMGDLGIMRVGHDCVPMSVGETKIELPR